MLREKGEKKKKKKEEEGELEHSELGRSDRLQKRKVVKREKWKVCVWRRKNQREKRGKKKKKKCGTCVEDKKKRGKKGKEMKRNDIMIFS